jgi:hypothetical protein
LRAGLRVLDGGDESFEEVHDTGSLLLSGDGGKFGVR